MRILTSAFATRDEFLRSYSAGFPEGALFCRTRSALSVDEDLLVEITFPGLVTPTLVRGAVAALDRPRGAWIRLHAGDAHGRDYMLGLARGTIEPAPQVGRGHRRIPAALPVTCHIDEPDEPARDRMLGHTHDVGGGGAFVHSNEPPAVGTRVSLTLGPTARRGDTFQLGGRVAWIRRDKRAHGFGVKFDSRDSPDGGRLRALLRRSWESGRFQLSPG